MVGQAAGLESLQTDWLLTQFGSERSQAFIGYQNFVRSCVGLPPVWEGLKSQIFLGNKDFVEKMQSRIKTGNNDLTEIPRAQRRIKGQPISFFIENYSASKEGMRKAFETGDYTMQQIAKAFGVHYSTVSRAVKKDFPEDA